MIQQVMVVGSRQEWLHADHLTGHDVLPLLQHTRLRVVSWSMFPTIHKGDRIELEQAYEVTVGDIVVYRQCGALVCHRVKALGSDGLVVTGSDGVDTGTDTVVRRDIIGRVGTIIRGRQRQPPMYPTPPAPLAFLHRMIDGWQTHVRRKARSMVTAILIGLTRRPVPRRLLANLFLNCLRFHINARLPIDSIPAYDMTRRSIRVRGTRRTRILVRELGLGTQPVLHAYLGPYHVGNVNLRSGDQRVHPLISGLGLEPYFSELLRQRFASQP